MNKLVRTIVIMTLFAVLLNVMVFVPSGSAAENLPTVWVKVYRIQAVDVIETVGEGEADWRYNITVFDGQNVINREFKCPQNSDEIVVDRSDSFTNIKNQDVLVTIALYEDDLSDSETADVSSSGTAFDCTYNLASNELGGDETVFEDGYYKTSGDYDGSEQTDENDANLWFAVFDNYDAPVADAGADQSVYAGQQVTFGGSLSTASEGSSIVKFEWDFEDDGVVDAEGETVSCSYEQKWTHTCRLVVTDSIGVTSEDTCFVTVQNLSPIAEFTFSPNNVSVHDAVNFTDTSSDPDGTIVSWLWDFGDGTNSTLQNPSHVYCEKGALQTTLTVTDDSGAQSLVTHSVVVFNLKPEASFNCTQSPKAGMEIQFTDNSVDPENKSVSWFWDFGDGETSELQAPTHKFASEGDYNVSLTVTDDENATDTYVMTVSVKDSGAFPLWVIGVVAVVIASACFVGLFWWSRRRRDFSEMFTGSEDPVNFVSSET